MMVPKNFGIMLSLLFADMNNLMEYYCSMIRYRKKIIRMKTRKQKRKSHITKNQMFRSLIQQAVNNHVLFDYVLADNWFGSKANMAFIHGTLKKSFIFGIKSNRCIAMTLNDAKSGQFQQVKSLDWNDGDCTAV